MMSHSIFRILVVDDNEASAKTMGWMMESLGHDVCIAVSSEEALKAAVDYRPQVVLLDIGLPSMSGYEVCERMREMEQTQDAFFIAQTGWTQPEHRVRSKKSGFHEHLVKPINLEQLKAIIAKFALRDAALPAAM